MPALRTTTTPRSSVPDRDTVTRRARAAAARMIAKARGAIATNGHASLIDAKAASRILGVPPTWLLAQARAGQIPHHRLGHYVRFNPDDLTTWLNENRIEPNGREVGRARVR